MGGEHHHLGHSSSTYPDFSLRSPEILALGPSQLSGASHVETGMVWKPFGMCNCEECQRLEIRAAGNPSTGVSGGRPGSLQMAPWGCPGPAPSLCRSSAASPLLQPHPSCRGRCPSTMSVPGSVLNPGGSNEAGPSRCGQHSGACL